MTKLAQLTTLVDQQQTKEAAELRAKLVREDQQRFFNRPSAQADFEHWGKAAYWKLDEAIALSFGKAPEQVTWERVEPHVKNSLFASEYQRRRDLVLRAAVSRILHEPTKPEKFLAWAKRFDLSIPPALDELQSQLQVAATPRTAKPEKSLSTRERESLLKLVIGMAVGGYGYDVKASRSVQPSTIVDDLAKIGLPLDADTVRKWLKEAAELLPTRETERD